MNTGIDPDRECACGKQGCGFGCELGKLLRTLRKHWFSKMDRRWSGPNRFVFTFLGAMTYMIAFAVFSVSRLPYLAFGADNLVVIGVYSVFLVVTGIFFGSIVAFRSTRAGPVRLYLAGLALPALVAFVIGYSLKYYHVALGAAQ